MNPFKGRHFQRDIILWASAEFTIGEGELMAHDVPLGCAPDEYDDLISGTCSHLP
ncbi:hypothetical protein FHA58_08900 [Escherichia coli]|uniref:hypothetical protein n=1 Tax=Escherichia coli TaxID=562 RepID=UPI001C70A9AE|nr:hypothetical protein [Escherichia coli]MBW9568666.1 hypothetical protein [Escherichia coli]